jgi:hypothetical protein
MTEHEWLTGESESAMRSFLWGKGTPRKWRLYGCACVRRTWAHLGAEGRHLVEVAERFCDGLASRAELSVAQDALVGAIPPNASAARQHAWEAAWHLADESAWDAAAEAAWMAYSAESARPAGWGDSPHAHAIRLAVLRAQCDLLRDLFGNPFRPVVLDPAWLTWNDGTVPRIARAVADECAFDRLPVLADALEEAGCAHPDVLAHCRRGGEHVRGCWLIDAILAKDR